MSINVILACFFCMHSRFVLLINYISRWEVNRCSKIYFLRQVLHARLTLKIEGELESNAWDAVFGAVCPGCFVDLNSVCVEAVSLLSESCLCCCDSSTGQVLEFDAVLYSNSVWLRFTDRNRGHRWDPLRIKCLNVTLDHKTSLKSKFFKIETYTSSE